MGAGTGVCVAATSADFCTRFDTACGSTHKWDTCATDFKGISEGFGTGAADTQACRLYHLGLAEKSTDDATKHCPHASKAGTGVCVAATSADFCTRFDTACGSTHKWDTCATDF